MLPNSSQLRLLVTQFQSRYPMASLVAELVTIHDNTFIVRALVQVGGQSLATGMASAASIEQAEDQAKIRALDALGMQPTLITPTLSFSDQRYAESHSNLPGIGSPPEPQSQQSGSNHSPDLEYPTSAQNHSTDATYADLSGELDWSPAEIKTEPVKAAVNTEFSSAEEQFDATPAPLPEPTPPASAPEKPKKTKKTNAESSAVSSPPEPDDKSDVIIRTDVELRRLGWTQEQGRKHLQETYGKRSRMHLNDEELTDFLHYLESQPSSSQSPF